MADTRIKQEIRVLEYLIENEYATRIDLLRYCSVANATAVITRLRKRGYVIDTEMVSDYNQFDEKVRYAKWKLIKFDNNLKTPNTAKTIEIPKWEPEVETK